MITPCRNSATRHEFVAYTLQLQVCLTTLSNCSYVSLKLCMLGMFASAEMTRNLINECVASLKEVSLQAAHWNRY